MRIGVTLPQFRDDPADALAAARAAEQLSVGGVFVFDHLWAIGRPDRPALACFPLMGALLAETATIAVGSLVARVSLLGDAVLVHEFETLQRIGGPRLIAGLGTGDRLSASENEAYGIPFPSVGERLRQLRECTKAVRDLGIETWVGGLSAAVRAVARDEGVALNLWGVDSERVASEARDGEVTWGGVVPGDEPALSALLLSLREAGATWAVCAPPYVPGEDPAGAVALVARASGALER